MPLRDHFHLPLRGHCTWESFHSGWANEIMRLLNKTLPPMYVARPNVKLGVDVEADVGTLEDSGHLAIEECGGVATAVWAPPRPTPVINRIAPSCGMDSTSGVSSEPAANSATVNRSVGLRPKRSPASPKIMAPIMPPKRPAPNTGPNADSSTCHVAAGSAWPQPETSSGNTSRDSLRVP